MSQLKATHSRQDHNLKQPINKLPPEILSQTFLLGDALARDDAASNRLDRFKDGIVQVCCYWRGVALNTTLWSHIVVDSRFPHARAAADLLRAEPTSLLDIYFDFTGQVIRGRNKHKWAGRAMRVRQSLDFIVSKGATFERWRSLRVKSHESYDIFTLLECVNTGTPALSSLAIRVSGPSPVYDIRPDRAPTYILLDFLGGSPQLRDLEVVNLGKPPHWRAKDCFPHMSNFTRLELVLREEPHWEDFCSLLTNNPDLEILFIDLNLDCYIDTGNPVPPDAVGVNLIHLREFTLRPHSQAWCQNALRLIHAPNTLVFCLDLGSWPTTRECETTMRLLCSAKCTLVSSSLRHLSLGLFRCSLEQFGKLFAICANLTRFDWVIEQNRAYSMMLSRPPWVLPKLSWMRVSSVTTQVPLDYMLEQTVDERQAAGLPLRVVEVCAKDWVRVGAETRIALGNVLEKVGSFENMPEPQLDESDSSEDSDGEGASDSGESSDDEGD